MKRILTPLFVLALASVVCAAGTRKATFAEFLSAINMKEASGQRHNVPKGDGGKARGPFQIWEEYWQDALEHDPSIGGTYADCEDYDYSAKIVTAYLSRYAIRALQKGDWETLARVHNGGPNGAKKAATAGYWKDVKKIMEGSRLH